MPHTVDNAGGPPFEPQSGQRKANPGATPETGTPAGKSRYHDVRFRMFFELMLNNFRTLLLLNFEYDEEMDWYEVKVSRGQQVIGYVHGYGNHGWNPQVNNIWVSRRFRRKGLGSLMMSKVEHYFGQVPLPGTPISDNEPARLFWKNYLTGRPSLKRKVAKPAAPAHPLTDDEP
jgi:GNAT superfamily N-acetyltransferase